MSAAPRQESVAASSSTVVAQLELVTIAAAAAGISSVEAWLDSEQKVEIRSEGANVD